MLTAGPSAGGGILRLSATIAQGWHVNSHRPSEDYLIATAAKLDAQSGVTFGEPVYPAGVDKKFAFSEAALSVYESAFAIEVPVMWDASRPPAVISGQLSTACNDKSCLARRARVGRGTGARALGAAPAARRAALGRARRFPAARCR